MTFSKIVFQFGHALYFLNSVITPLKDDENATGMIIVSFPLLEAVRKIATLLFALETMTTVWIETDSGL